MRREVSALVAVSFALAACKAPGPPSNQGSASSAPSLKPVPGPVPTHPLPAPHPPRVPEPQLPHTAQPPTLSTPATIALAVDQSASMRGFAATGAMTTAIGNAERAIRDAVHARATYYSLGQTAEKVPTDDKLFDPGEYKKDAADLRAVLEVPALRDAGLLVVFTDGQPTAGPLGMCTTDGTQVISDLHSWFASRTDAGAAWIVLDKIPFAGRFFLNCRGADKMPEIASRLGKLGKRPTCDARECWYDIPNSPAQDRTLVGIVVAKPEFEDAAAAVVDGLLRAHPSATAVRLHRSSHDRDAVAEVTASLVGNHANLIKGKDIDRAPGDPTTYTIRAHCPDRQPDQPDMVVRVCVRLRASPPPAGQLLVSMSRPEIVDAQASGTAHTIADWLELPAGQSLDPAVVQSLRPERHQCPRLWQSYLARTGASSRARGGSADCVGGDGIEVHELVTACSCRAQSPSTASATEIRFVQSYRSTEDSVEHELARTFSADPRLWFEQPDRVNGLSELVHLLATAHGFDPAPHTVLRLVIDVDRR